jgi:hypothetical protein
VRDLPSAQLSSPFFKGLDDFVGGDYVRSCSVQVSHGIQIVTPGLDKISSGFYSSLRDVDPNGKPDV